MQWFYLTDPNNPESRVGPIADNVLLKRIHDGGLTLHTSVASNESTNGQWIELQYIPPFKAAYDAGVRARQEENDRLQRERRQEAAKARLEQNQQAEQRRQEAEKRRSEQMQSAEIQQQQASAVAIRIEKQRDHVRDIADLQPVFKRYWMPEYLRAIWLANLILAGLFVLAAWGLAIVGIAAQVAAESSFGVMLFLGFVQAGVATCLAALYVTLVRLTLESFAVIFDIRGLLKRQVALLQERDSR